MKVSIVAVMLALLLGLTRSQESDFDTKIQNLEHIVASLKTSLSDLSRQTMLLQFGVEERARIESDSGVKIIRSRKNHGLKNYNYPSHVGDNVNAIHDHSNYKSTVGMGEVSVNMNGVNFRTRHNDYKLVMPSTTSKEYRAIEDTPFPDVPPSVKGTVEEQIEEMKEWFKAFATQNYTVRDYRKYFIPVMCYLEGTWTLDKDILEPFSSDRHHIEADSWHHLQERVRFMSYTGSKSNFENLAFLPTAILSIDSTTGDPVYAQWNYRILCKPSHVDVPLRTVKHVDDMAYRMRAGGSVEDAANSRAARFKIFDDERTDGYQIIDEVFYGIPGMDNLPADDMVEATLKDLEVHDAAPSKGKALLKTGYYHRQYKFIKKGALGENVNARGYNDENLWVAQNTQSRVAPFTLEVCGKQRGNKPPVCEKKENRFSYALPLELIYLTPLLTWNPYDIEIHEDAVSSVANKGDGRTKPYDGADLEHYYFTPIEFFSDTRDKDRDTADTSKKSVKVKDKQGNTRQVVASGTRILLPNIPDIGKIRLRYPVSPISNEGSPVWKELTAFKDYVNAWFGKAAPEMEEEEVEPENVLFEMSPTIFDPPGEHTHAFSVTYQQFKGKLMKEKVVRLTTEYRQRHDHIIKIKYDDELKQFVYFQCDRDELCWDGHPKELILKTLNSYTDVKNFGKA